MGWGGFGVGQERSGRQIRYASGGALAE